MSEITISSPGLVLASGFEILLPFILSFIWIKKYNATISPILIGIIGFIGSVFVEGLFALLLTQIFDKNSIIITIIGRISPGLFEETGRYICLSYIFSNNKLKNVSVSYGIGHGGIESIFIGLIFATGLFTKDVLIEKGYLNESITLYTCLISICERLFAVIIHISLSVIVYKAVKEKVIIYYIASIIIHDLIDFFPFLRNKKIINSIIIIEIIIGLLSICLGYYSHKLYINLEEIKEEENVNLIPLANMKESSLIREYE